MPQVIRPLCLSIKYCIIVSDFLQCYARVLLKIALFPDLFVRAKIKMDTY